MFLIKDLNFNSVALVYHTIHASMYIEISCIDVYI